MSKNVRTLVDRTCAECGKPFQCNPYQVKIGKGRYCSQGCAVRSRPPKHGHTTKTSQSGTYVSYQNMLARCYRKSSDKYATYGAIGVTVCDRWRESFENFLADMGERPEGTTIDRWPNQAGNYEPGNCRWASIGMQQRNIRSNVFVEYNGQRKCIAEWAQEFGLDKNHLAWRLRKGWPVDKALTTKPCLGNRVRPTSTGGKPPSLDSGASRAPAA